MALKLNEVAINKACSVKLNDKLTAIVALFYHTADKKANPDDKSWYQYEVRIDETAKLEAEAQDMLLAENRLKDWKWPNPSWANKAYVMGYDNGNDQSKGGKWLRMKVKKALDWDTYVKLVKDGIKVIASKKAEVRYPHAAYDTEGFLADDGKTAVSILDRDALISLAGHYLSKPVPLKRDLKA